VPVTRRLRSPTYLQNKDNEYDKIEDAFLLMFARAGPMGANQGSFKFTFIFSPLNRWAKAAPQEDTNVHMYTYASFDILIEMLF
jgi:hypothetical protein